MNTAFGSLKPTHTPPVVHDAGALSGLSFHITRNPLSPRNL